MVNDNNDQTFSPFSSPQVDLGVYTNPNVGNEAVQPSQFGDIFVAEKPEIKPVLEPDVSTFVPSFEELEKGDVSTDLDLSTPSPMNYTPTLEETSKTVELTPVYESQNEVGFDEMIEELENTERNLNDKINALGMNLEKLIRGNDELLRSIEEQNSRIKDLSKEAQNIVVNKKRKAIAEKENNLNSIEAKTQEAIKSQNDLSNKLNQNEQVIARLKEYIDKERGLGEERGRSIVYEQNAA